jgi:hypothetical protein
MSNPTTRDNGDSSTKGPELSALEPQVRGESRYDRVTSMLMAVVVGTALVVGFLGMIYWTNKAYANRVTAPLEIVDVAGGGGGVPEGTPGSSQAIDVPGAEPMAQASNATEETASDLVEPSVQQTTGAVIEASDVASSAEAAEEFDVAPTMSSGGGVARGRRASRLGTGGPALGFGGGDGGLGREQRWSIIYPQGQTPEEYARQLDALGVELAVPAGAATLDYASSFASASPARRTGPVRADTRLWFLWQGAGRKANDATLLQRAGITVGDKPIFQFYPKASEDLLARLEVQYRGRQPGEIRVTRFQVVPRGNTFGFQVVAQETFR